MVARRERWRQREPNYAGGVPGATKSWYNCFRNHGQLSSRLSANRRTVLPSLLTSLSRTSKHNNTKGRDIFSRGASTEHMGGKRDTEWLRDMISGPETCLDFYPFSLHFRSAKRWICNSKFHTHWGWYWKNMKKYHPRLHPYLGVWTYLLLLVCFMVLFVLPMKGKHVMADLCQGDLANPMIC